MDVDDYLLALRSWWARKYNKPLKDPVLQTYTFEDLLYEFHDSKEREAARLQSSSENSDKIEQDRLQESLDWAEQEELRELERFKAQQAKAAKAAEEKPAESGIYVPSPEDQEWMQKQMDNEAAQLISKGKQDIADDFGDDLRGSFDDGE